MGFVAVYFPIGPVREAAGLAAEDPDHDVGGVQLRGYISQQRPRSIQVHHLLRLGLRGVGVLGIGIIYF